MRARLALRSAAIEVELREIILRDKPEDFLAASTTQTVPVLVLQDGEVIEESRDIMLWALQRSGDPENWLAPYHADKEAVSAFFDRLTGHLTNLDRYKYAARFFRDKQILPVTSRSTASRGLFSWANWNRNARQKCLSGAQMGILDFACLPLCGNSAGRYALV